MAKQDEPKQRKKPNRRPMSKLMRVVSLIDRNIRDLDTQAERQQAFKILAALVENEAPLFQEPKET